MDNIQVIDMYNDAILNEIPVADRKSNWAQPFFKTPEIMPFINTQFSDMKKRAEELLEFKTKS